MRGRGARDAGCLRYRRLPLRFHLYTAGARVLYSNHGRLPNPSKLPVSRYARRLVPFLAPPDTDELRRVLANLVGVGVAGRYLQCMCRKSTPSAQWRLADVREWTTGSRHFVAVVSVFFASRRLIHCPEIIHAAVSHYASKSIMAAAARWHLDLLHTRRDGCTK